MPQQPQKQFTLAHVTHEAVEQIGGIGTVLEGLITSPVYQKHVKRSILVGPTAAHLSVDPNTRLGAHGQVLYSSIDKIDRIGLSARFRPIEWAFNIAIVYGKRTFHSLDGTMAGEAEVILIDCFRVNTDRLNVFKARLFETFGIDCMRYQSSWDFEEYVRLAEPAYYALQAILTDADKPCVLFSHEFMGMPAALAAILEGKGDFRTVFHAHECSTARHIVEGHVGHDTMFYNVLDQAINKGKYVDDIFGSMDSQMRHALVSRTHLCDGIIAVGDRTRDEMKFLGPKFKDHPIDLVYNGLPNMKVTPASKSKSRDMLLEYAHKLVGFTPDVLMTHVTRPVISKGLWRDMKVCHHLDAKLGAQGKKGVLFILTSGGGTRRAQDIAAMEDRYGWPRHHKPGYPDLSGPENDINAMIEPFNAEHKNVQVVLVNQFGWTRKLIGSRLPANMDFADLRRATDVEFGMAVYEPFGISPLEPLGSGAICVISSVCGCYWFVQHATKNKGTPNVLVADFTQLDGNWDVDQLLSMNRTERDRIEQVIAGRVADELMERIPFSEQARRKLVSSGQTLVAKMGWDQVITDGLLPMLERIRRLPIGNGNGHSL